MNTFSLTINGQPVQAAPGETLLDAAKKLGIAIPILCHLDGVKPFTSCMVCAVEETRWGKLLPACSTPVQPGLVLETENDRVKAHRKNILALLMSEHVGDCEGPCQRVCPAHMDIPRMMREIETDQWDKAIATIKAHIPLPAVLGRICPAPCEKGCRRTQVDAPMAICLLKMVVADWDLARDTPYQPEKAPATGKRVAVVGSGPAGLSAAYYLLTQGHAVEILEAQEALGGELRLAVPDIRLPRAVLDAEIAQVLALGAEVKTGVRLDETVTLAELRKRADAVILATGAQGEILIQGVEHTDQGIKVDPETLATSLAGVFAAGGAIRHSRLAVRSVAQGRQAALSVHRLLMGTGFGPRSWKINSHVGRLLDEEIAAYQSSSPEAVVYEGGMTHEAAMTEAARCLHCECAKPESCGLRTLAEAYEAQETVFAGESRAMLRRIPGHGRLVYEPGKCIKCGLCVRITEAEKERLGLTFIGRGFNVTVGAPLNRPLSEALAQTAEHCAQACPTGALSVKKPEETRS